MISQLVKRGFNFFKVNQISNIIAGISRDNFLNYKNKNIDNYDINTYFNCLYDHSFPHLNKIIKHSWNNFINKRENNCFKTTNFYITNSLHQNLKKIFIFDAKPPKIYNFRTSYCDDTNCEICKFIVHYSFIKIKIFFTIQIQNNSNCKSENVVYFIFCMKCNFFILVNQGDVVTQE